MIVHNQVISVHAAYSIVQCIYGVSSRKHEVIAARHPIDAWYNTVCCVYRSNLLIMNDYFFETCRDSLMGTN